jgi:SAM-dependent methyltransferase
LTPRRRCSGASAVAARKRGVGGMIGTFSYDAYTRDTPDSAYDVVINLQGIQHTEDWTAAGKEFLRIMKPGRRLVMAEIVLGSPEQVWKISSDLHIQHLFDKIFSRRGVAFSDLPYYSPQALRTAFDGLVNDPNRHDASCEALWPSSLLRIKAALTAIEGLDGRSNPSPWIRRWRGGLVVRDSNDLPLRS